MIEKTPTQARNDASSIAVSEPSAPVRQALADLPQTLPYDEHNETLVANVHPLDWVNPEPAGRYNMVVIGAGTAGLVTAAGAAGLGARVALIERALMGGDCLNVGCVPSKALIRSARAYSNVMRAGEFGVRVPDGTEVEFPAVMERMRRLRAGISPHDSANRFSDLGIDMFIGQARFLDGRTVEVDGRRLDFARACIATGARAAALPIPGLAEAGYLTNETVFSLTELPRRLAVIGAGPIGCELAQTFARFGAETTLLEAAPQILIREDRDAASIVEDALKRDDVRLICSANIVGVRRVGNERIVELDNGRQVEVDQILLGVGRAPNVEGLGLEEAGVEFNTQTGVNVDDKLRTTNTRIYAAGDVCSAYKFTHAADFMARIVIRNALFFGRAKASALTIPWCTYTDPEIAHVGLYKNQAAAKSIETQTFEVKMSDVDRAILDGETDGFLKVLVKRDTDKILGATLVAPHAGEMISEIALAMKIGAGLGSIANAIHPYPTQADVIRKAGDAYMRTKLTPRLQRIFERIMRFRRR
jgi:pyruvate/2-oxoglutarate dehydrogenase complex dihydrolipoamide dehydrogenase (E3) component